MFCQRSYNFHFVFLSPTQYLIHSEAPDFSALAMFNNTKGNDAKGQKGAQGKGQQDTWNYADIFNVIYKLQGILQMGADFFGTSKR